MRGRIVRLEDNGLLNPLRGDIMPAKLVSNHAKEMPGLGMVGLRGEDLTVPAPLLPPTAQPDGARGARSKACASGIMVLLLPRTNAATSCDTLLQSDA